MLLSHGKFHINLYSGCLQCGRAFDPNFLFLWPNARVSIVAPGHSNSLLPCDGEHEEDFNMRLMEESSAFFSSGRLWDDGVILPQHTRKVNQLLSTLSEELFLLRGFQIE